MNKGVNAGLLITGLGVGAGCMYLLDPDRGRRRRAVLRDKGGSAYRELRESIEKAKADLTNRTQGIVASVKSLVQHQPVGDDQLVGRVRAKLGRLVSHPHAINVSAQNGRVTLSGDVLESEAARLLERVAVVPGVCSISNQLLRHAEKSGIPNLQNGRERHGGNALQWTPATRLIAGIAGGTLGALLVARGISNGRS